MPVKTKSWMIKQITSMYQCTYRYIALEGPVCRLEDMEPCTESTCPIRIKDIIVDKGGE